VNYASSSDSTQEKRLLLKQSS